MTDPSMRDIPGHETFARVTPLIKGWSTDKKYTIETQDGRRLLLRTADISQYDRKKAEYETMRRAAALGVPIPQPLDFGTCDGGKTAYTLLTWCDGEDAETALPGLSQAEQYALGQRSGEILRRIHEIPATEDREDWAARFGRKTDAKIEKYRACGMRFEGDEAVIEYLGRNRGLLEGRPQRTQHGDYHVGNMILSPNGALQIIDWNRPDYGDPWEEFNRIVWSAAVSPHFATGQIHGYFGGEPPTAFFRLLAYYIASNTLSSIYWAIPFGPAEIDTMMNQARDVLSWYDQMRDPVPAWYIREIRVQRADGVPYRLRSAFDFSFLSRYGRVFTVLDDQDSGNICFGADNGGKKTFIKFAGARTLRAEVPPDAAIANLRAAVPAYRDLAHENLIRLVEDLDVAGGYAAVFEWTDGACMGRMYPKARERFLGLPLETRLRVFEEILAFHAHVIQRGYVAIDFYDGSIMYDFEKRRTLICDIDFYAKRPYINRLGRLWGSARFMSPEEFTLGAEIDEVTNVYAMGATAFALFAGYDRSRESWPLGDARYHVARRAVSDAREERQGSIRAFIEAWGRAGTDAQG